LFNDVPYGWQSSWDRIQNPIQALALPPPSSPICDRAVILTLALVTRLRI
jgi:hypothetical protein